VNELEKENVVRSTHASDQIKKICGKNTGILGLNISATAASKMVPTHSSNPIMYGSVENVNTQRLLA
jgi:hypothetical protein